jgi:hypothetical protein
MKIFCIGYNKTGTTSLTEFMRINGFLIAPQTPFEYNLNSYIYGNNSTFIEMIKNDYYNYTFFQDVPFSLPNFYKTLDQEFENSKYILTVRNNPDQWYNSLISYHKSKFENFKNPSQIQYVYHGWVNQILTNVYKSPKYDPYNEKHLKKSYSDHINSVKEYFKDKKDKLLILNLETDSPKILQNFLGVKLSYQDFPHINKST